MAYVSIRSAPGDIKSSLRGQMMPNTAFLGGPEARRKAEKANREDRLTVFGWLGPLRAQHLTGVEKTDPILCHYGNSRSSTAPPLYPPSPAFLAHPAVQPSEEHTRSCRHCCAFSLEPCLRAAPQLELSAIGCRSRRCSCWSSSGKQLLSTS